MDLWETLHNNLFQWPFRVPHCSLSVCSAATAGLYCTWNRSTWTQVASEHDLFYHSLMEWPSALWILNLQFNHPSHIDMERLSTSRLIFLFQIGEILSLHIFCERPFVLCLFFIDSAELAKVYQPITNYKDIQSRCFSWLIIRIQVRTSIGELYFVMADLNFVFLFRSNFRHSSRSHEAFTCCSIIVGNRVRRLHEYYQYILSSSCSWTTSFPR